MKRYSFYPTQYFKHRGAIDNIGFSLQSVLHKDDLRKSNVHNLSSAKLWHCFTLGIVGNSVKRLAVSHFESHLHMIHNETLVLF